MKKERKTVMSPTDQVRGVFKALSFNDHKNYTYECDLCLKPFVSGGFSWDGGVLYVCSADCVQKFNKAMEDM